MIPLMMQKKYKPQGWRESEHQVPNGVFPIAIVLTWNRVVLAVGLIMGTRLWHVADHAMHSTLSVHCCWFRLS